jgi:diaminopimelate epimerase
MSEGPSLVKMSGAGNDFVVLDAEQYRLVESQGASWIRKICRRGLSVGADGVLVVDPLADGTVRVRFFNPDGSSAFCGNGSRCAARFAQRRGLAGSRMILRTEAGDVPAEILGERVRLTLPEPIDVGDVSVICAGRNLNGRLVRSGVPHFVVWSDAIDEEPLGRWGPVVRHDPVFGTEGTNLDLIALRDDGQVAVRTWERGVNAETLACGSGAVAAARVAGLRTGQTALTVIPASGIPLTVSLRETGGEAGTATLEGDARFVLEGTAGAETTRGFPD